MDKEEATALINAAGGNKAFAELLGLDADPGYMQRVSNWRDRGIPARVILEHQLVIESLRRKAKAAA